MKTASPRWMMAFLVFGWLWLHPAAAQNKAWPATTPELSAVRQIVVLQYQDIFDDFDRRNVRVESPKWRESFRSYNLGRYASRKREFTEFAATRGITVVDAFPDLPMLAVSSAIKATAFHGAPWFAYVAPDQDMHLHLDESAELINKHLLRQTFPDADPNKLRGNGTAVMILDTGVDYLVQELGGCVGPKCKVIVAKDFTPQDDNERDVNRHGTNVAAIAAGTRGIASEARIIAGDIMDIQGKISTSYVLNAISWAIANRDKYNIVAINMSFGGGPYFKNYCSQSAYGPAVAEAYRSGIVVVASAGNDFNPDGMPEPACVPYVVSVGAVFDGGAVNPAICEGKHPVDEVTCFSNTSLITSLLAPGAEITAGGESMSGTSQAAPHVSGAVAVLRSMEPQISVAEIEKRLRLTGIPIQDKRNGRSIARLDLVALLQGSLQRPLPLPAVQEWWRTGMDGETQLPVLTDPWFGSLLGTLAGTYDQATSILWSQPDPALISTSVPLRTAQNYCRRINKRLPTRHEMDSVQDVRRLQPTINEAIFANVTSGPYWTLTPVTRQGAMNWVVDLSDGRAYWANAASAQANFFCVAALRGDPPPQHYDDQGQTITDKATGHTWQKGTVVAQDHQALADACVGSTVAAKRWRVPTWKELSTLLSSEYESPYIDPLFSGEKALVSSTPAVKRGLEFRIVNFQNGISTTGTGTATRCIEQSASQPAAPARVFNGNVYIAGKNHALSTPEMQQFEAGMYTAIEGNLVITGTESASIILPYLKTVKGRLAVNETQATWISLPALESVGASLEITDNTKLDAVWLPALASIDGSLVIRKNRRLGASQKEGDAEQVVSLDLPALERIHGDFQLELNTQLKSVTLNRLKVVGRGLNVASNISMWQLVLNSLESVGTACTNHEDFCGDLSIQSNSRLQVASLPTLATIGYDLRVSGNPVLETLQQRLDNVSGLFADFNPSMCEGRQLDPILSRMWRLDRFPAKVYIYNNSAKAGCRTRCPNESPTACEIQRDPTPHAKARRPRHPSSHTFANPRIRLLCLGNGQGKAGARLHRPPRSIQAGGSFGRFDGPRAAYAGISGAIRLGRAGL